MNGEVGIRESVSNREDRKVLKGFGLVERKSGERLTKKGKSAN